MMEEFATLIKNSTNITKEDVNSFITRGLNINSSNVFLGLLTELQTPLQYACINRRTDLVDALLECDVDVLNGLYVEDTIVGYHGCNESAATVGYIIKKLIDKGAPLILTSSSYMFMKQYSGKDKNLDNILLQLNLVKTDSELKSSNTTPRPVHEIKAPEDNIIKDRIRGMLAGAFLGDALGAPHEFTDEYKYTGKLQYPVRLPGSRFHGDRFTKIGQVTDDTEMTLALISVLVKNWKAGKRGNDIYNRDDAIWSYISWANSKQPFMGRNTKELFHGLIPREQRKGLVSLTGFGKRYQNKTGFDYNTSPLTKISEQAELMQSNGALMRCCSLVVLDDSCALQDAWISNPSKDAVYAELAYIHILKSTLQGYSPLKIWKHIKSNNYGSTVAQSIKDIENGRCWTLSGEVTRGNNKHNVKGWVMTTLHVVLICLNIVANTDKYDGSTFTSIMEWIISDNPGSDSDTNACVAGAFLGALLGWKLMMTNTVTEYNFKILKSDEASDLKRPTEYKVPDLDLHSCEVVDILYDIYVSQ